MPKLPYKVERNKIGHGSLTWDGGERRSDRYGSVWLMPDHISSITGGGVPASLIEKSACGLAGQRGELIAVITQNRDSTHIGDLFRGISPSKPEIGEIIKLGNGTIFFETWPYGGVVVGLYPDDGRGHDWLDPKALYRAHEQTVDLFFHPTGGKDA